MKQNKYKNEISGGMLTDVLIQTQKIQRHQ